MDIFDNELAKSGGFNCGPKGWVKIAPKSFENARKCSHFLALFSSFRNNFSSNAVPCAVTGQTLIFALIKLTAFCLVFCL